MGGERDFYNEDLLYKLFGVNAELLIDHAWGWEPCTMADIKGYRAETNSLHVGQVLQKPYDYAKAKLIVKEMTDQLALDLVRKELVCTQVTLTIGYDIDNLTDEGRRAKYKGEVTIDYYGREVPKHAHGTERLGEATASGTLIMEAMLSIFDRTVDPNLLVRRVTICANNIMWKDAVKKEEENKQLSLFDMMEAGEEKLEEARMQETLIAIKKKFGKNAVVKAMNLEEGATAMSRNKQIGGHKA